MRVASCDGTLYCNVKFQIPYQSQYFRQIHQIPYCLSCITLMVSLIITIILVVCNCNGNCLAAQTNIHTIIDDKL